MCAKFGLIFTPNGVFFGSERGAWVDICVAEIVVFIHVSDSELGELCWGLDKECIGFIRFSERVCSAVGSDSM